MLTRWREVISYLQQYAEHFQLPIVANARVAQVARESEIFTAQTDDGRTFQARSLIAATGSFHFEQNICVLCSGVASIQLYTALTRSTQVQKQENLQ